MQISEFKEVSKSNYIVGFNFNECNVYGSALKEENESNLDICQKAYEDCYKHIKYAEELLKQGEYTNRADVPQPQEGIELHELIGQEFIPTNPTATNISIKNNLNFMSSNEEKEIKLDVEVKDQYGVLIEDYSITSEDLKIKDNMYLIIPVTDKSIDASITVIAEELKKDFTVVIENYVGQNNINLYKSIKKPNLLTKIKNKILKKS